MILKNVFVVKSWVNRIHLCWDVVIDPHLVMKSMIQSCFCCQIYYLFIIKILLHLVISITLISIGILSRYRAYQFPLLYF